MDFYFIFKMLILFLPEIFFIIAICDVVIRSSFIRSGSAFDITIKPCKQGYPSKYKIIVFFCICFLCVPVYLPTLFDCLLNHFPLFIFNIVFFVCLGVFIMWFKHSSLIRKAMKDDNALVFGQLKIVQDIDEKISSTTFFDVKRDRVTIGAIEEIYYRDYNLRELSDDESLAVFALYFLQRHHKDFKMKIITKNFTYYTGGIRLSRDSFGGYSVTKETESKRVLDYYMFCRKK